MKKYIYTLLACMAAFICYMQTDDSSPLIISQSGTSDVKKTIEELMDQNRVEEAKARLDQLFILLQSTTQSKMLDTSGKNPSQLNVGFINDRAVYIDRTKLQMTSKIALNDLFIKNLQTLKPLNKWLMLHYPVLSIYYQNLCKKTLSTFDEELS